jgi:hypothetical protein
MRRPRHAAVATGWRVWSQAGYDRSCVCPELGIGLYQGLVGPAGVSGFIAQEAAKDPAHGCRLGV